MFSRIAASVLLVLFLLSGLSTVVPADEDQAMMDAFAKRQELLMIAMNAEPKEPVEAVAALSAPPSSETVALADLPEDAARTLQQIYQYKEGDLIFLSTATPGEVQTQYAEELATFGYGGSMMLDENGKPISPAFSYMCDLGVIRVAAADDAVPDKTLVAVIIIEE